MKKSILIVLSAGLLLFGLSTSVFAGKKKITVSASESDAKIYVDGVLSGNGRVTFTVLDNSCVTVKTEKTAYLVQTITFCNRKNAAELPSTYYIELKRDDSYDASVQTDIANIDMEVRSTKPYADAWKLVNQIVVSYIDAIEITDKETGYVRTSWEVQSFSQNTVRTRIIVKLGSENPLSFKIKLVSEYATAPLTSVKSDELFRDWDRVLRKYSTLMSELQSRLQ